LYKAHRKNSHKTKTSCEQCGGMFTQIDLHMKTMHILDNEKKYPCTECGKGFALKFHLKNHAMNMHIKSQPYQCRYGCVNSYNDQTNRIAHEKRKHGQVYKQ
jgi:KRAB domain-containing zinc finger protein